MCEFCHSAPHLPGCPNEPEVDHTKRCAICGEQFDWFDLIEGVCEECLEKSFTSQKMLEFVQEDPVEFIEWYFDVNFRGSAFRDEVTHALMETFMEHYRRERKLALDELKEYCYYDLDAWMDFIGVET